METLSKNFVIKVPLLCYAWKAYSTPLNCMRWTGKQQWMLSYVIIWWWRSFAWTIQVITKHVRKRTCIVTLGKSAGLYMCKILHVNSLLQKCQILVKLEWYLSQTSGWAHSTPIWYGWMALLHYPSIPDTSFCSIEVLSHWRWGTCCESHPMVRKT